MADEKLSFKSKYNVVPLDNVGVFLVSENDYSVLDGELYHHLSPLLDGSNSEEEIINKLGGKLSPAEVYYGLATLRNKDYISTVTKGKPEEKAFWELYGTKNDQVNQVKLQLEFFNLTDISDDDLLRHFDPEVFISGKEGLAIVITDNYNNSKLAKFSKDFREQNRPWLIVKPVGLEVCIGPLFIKEEDACYSCLKQRLQNNNVVEKFLSEQTGGDVYSPLSYTNSSANLAFSLTALELEKWVKTGNRVLHDKIISYHTKEFTSNEHIVVKRPQCVACGNPEIIHQINKAPIEFKPQYKSEENDGGSRAKKASAAWQEYKHHISKLSGAVEFLRPMHEEGEQHVLAYEASFNFATHVNSLSFLKKNLRSQSGGKGKTEIQAKVSALCEALERYSGVYRGEEYSRFTTMKELGESAIHPNECMLFSEEQFVNRIELNEANKKHTFISQYIPHRFDENEPTDWSPVWSITDQQFKYLPSSFCWYNYQGKSKYPNHKNLWSCVSDSNGCAAGTSLEDAALQGLMELVERDSVAIWWYNKLKVQAVDLASLNDPYIDMLVNKFKQDGRDLWVLDITSDLGIPSFAAVNVSREMDNQEIVIGFGAHLDARIGITRAVTEVNQFLASFRYIETQVTHNKYLVFDEACKDWWENAKLENNPYLVPKDSPLKNIEDYPQIDDHNITDVLNQCIDKLHQKDMEVLILDQTRPDIGLSVVRMIVPGLRHMWARFAPGRLFDSPVQQGYLEKPNSQDDLNPIIVFF